MAVTGVAQRGTGPWDARVQFRIDASGATFAYRPHQIVMRRAGLAALAEALGRPVPEDAVENVFAADDSLVLVRGVPNPLELVRRLRVAGHDA